MLFAFQDTDFALAHEAAEPSHVIGGDTGVFAAVVDDDWAVDILVSEADALLCLEADDQVGGGIRVCGCTVPDCECEALVECVLAFTFGESERFLHALRLHVVGIRGTRQGERTRVG